jgi:hypothetical protein
MAIQLAGINNDCHLISPFAYNMPALNMPFSEMTWVKLVNLSGVQSIFGCFDSSVMPHSAAQLGVRNNTFNCWLYGGTVLVSFPSPPPILTWFHVAYTFDGTTHSIYYNGNLVNTSTIPSQAGTITDIAFNGFPLGNSTETSASQVDDARVYDRTLSADEIKTIYSLNGKDTIWNGCKAKYLFKESSPNQTVLESYDFSENDNTVAVAGAGTNNFIYVESSLSTRRNV